MWISEQTANARPLLWSLAIMLLGLGAAEVWLAHYSQDHVAFGAILREATREERSDVVILGDSRMVAGVDPELMNGLLARDGRSRRVAYLAIGGMDIPGQALALRRYFERAETSLVVLGFSSTLLVPPTEPHRDPDEMVDNAGIELAWSEASDVTMFFPGFPFRHTEPGLRFLLNRQTALGSYRSLAWLKASTLRDRLIGRPPRVMNRFGAVDDMRKLVGAFAADTKLAVMSWQPPKHEGVWFHMIAKSAFSHGTSLLAVDVPMRRDYLEAVASRRLNQYTAALQTDLRVRGVGYANFSGLEAVASGDFPDGIHLGTAGRERFTRALCESIQQALEHPTKRSSDSP